MDINQNVVSLALVGVGDVGCAQLAAFGKQIKHKQTMYFNIIYIEVQDRQDISKLDFAEFEPQYIFILTGAADCALAGQAAAALPEESEEYGLKIGIMLDNAGKTADEQAMAEFKQNVNSMLWLAEPKIQQEPIARFIFSIIGMTIYSSFLGIDFADMIDVKNVLNNGRLKFALGSNNDDSDKRAELACQDAWQALTAQIPLAEIDGLSVCILGDYKLSMEDIDDVADYISNHCKEELDIIITAGCTDDFMKTLFPDKFSVALVANKKNDE